MSLSRLGILIVVALGLVSGVGFFCSWWQIFKLRDAPVVTGQVLERTRSSIWGVPSVDFTIRVEGGAEMVHARTGVYLLDRVPSSVRFHYSGTASEEVFLFEYERNPFWLFIFSSSVALLFSASLIWKVGEENRLKHSSSAPPLNSG